MIDSFCLSDDLSKYDKKKITLIIIKDGRETIYTNVAEFIDYVHLGQVIKLSLDGSTIFIQNTQDFIVDDKYGGDYIVRLMHK